MSQLGAQLAFVIGFAAKGGNRFLSFIAEKAVQVPTSKGSQRVPIDAHFGFTVHVPKCILVLYLQRMRGDCSDSSEVILEGSLERLNS